MTAVDHVAAGRSPSGPHQEGEAAGSGSTRFAASPREYGAKAWLRIARRACGTLARENFTLIAAGCAFYALLAMAPALAALVTLYGYVFDPADIARQLRALEDVMPPDAFALLAAQVEPLAATSSRTLGWASLATALLAIWTARAGVRALMDGVAVAYREREGRGFLTEMAIAYGLTAVFVVMAAITIAMVVAVPAALAALARDGAGGTVAAVLRWPIALGAMAFALALLYRYGPPRRSAKPRWLTPGAVGAVALWLLASAGLNLYVARVENLTVTYGALGAIAALLLWFWVSALAALAGAVLNAELELATAVDSTVGADKPMGERGAVVADTVVEA